jgi:DNA-binding MarR family transcriptional regulator
MSSAEHAVLASALRLAVTRLARRMRKERAQATLALSQLAALATVDRLGPLTPGELAAEERVKPPSVTRLIVSLEAAELIQRVVDPDDRRQVLLSITPTGSALIEEDRRQREAWLCKQLLAVPAHDLAVLREAVAILDRLAAA